MSDALDGFARIVRETLGDTGLVLTRQTVTSDVPGWDSAAMVSMILAVEQEFGIRVRSRDLDGIASLGDMVDMIERRTRGRRGAGAAPGA